MTRYLLHHLVEDSAEEHAERVAVVDGDRSVTYAELEGWANRVANLLVDLGVARGDRVGLYLDKSVESVVGIYAVLKAGAAYVPFDPHAPTARLAYIAADCGIRVLLTCAEKSGSWRDLTAAGAPIETLILLNADEPSEDGVPPGVRVLSRGAVAAQRETAPDVPAIDLDLAYILYTSGSTGYPKGVKLSHLNAMTFVRWAGDLVSVGPEDRLSSHAPFHFDLSVFDLYAAAGAGAAVVLVPQETSVFPIRVAEFIERNAITIWYSVPSILSMLTLRGNLKGGEFPRLRVIYFAGEVFPTKYLRRLMSLLPHVEFYNLYGPTETNVCTFFKVPPLPEGMSEPIPIGRAIDDVEVFAVTEEGSIAEPGEVGELHVRGTTVMQGYWGDPERTGRVLFPNTFNEEVRDPVYRTGDLVRLDEDGDYRLLGRRDHQIKSRGYRIELGEIESVLYGHPSVVECAIIAVPDELVTNRIMAFVVARDGLSPNELMRFCGSRIPNYMIPEMFEFRDALPKTSTGKVDRQRLSSNHQLNTATKR
jgi:amino acid adenylation domain-containing protein